MTKEALGKGRAAIFEGLDQQPATSNQPPVTSIKAEASDQQPDTVHQSPVASSKIDESILDQALAEAKGAPKITVFSPKVAAVLRYKQLTTIRYSFSTEARERLEQTIKDAYPELYEAVEKALAKK
jgi:membrane-bound lytic murein transglycosylase B